jgi:cytochrome c5
MKSLKILVGLVLSTVLAVSSYHLIGAQRASAQTEKGGASPSGFDDVVRNNSERTLKEGQQTFRFDTFGDEAWWGDTLHLHEAIEGVKLGGIGPGISPATALSLGLKVDLDALPQSLVQQIKMGKVNLNDPAVTLALLKLNAVVGVAGHSNPDGSLKSVGIQCALCHSTVDNALAPGIGHRLDGWANRDLNVGAIIAAAPNLHPIADLLSTDQATVRKVLNSWGPGKFDAELLLDGKAFRPDGKPAATLIPPAFGLAGINLHTWTGWGSVPHWNALVANLEMRGKGDFYDSRLDDAAQFPIAAANHFGHIQNNPDLITAKLPALHLYQLSIPAPTPVSSSFDRTAADRGRELFSGKAKCSTCHADSVFTEPGWNMHKASEVCVDDFQANRAPDHAYRTTPLNGLWTHTKGGFYHDGRFATLADVVNHYDTCFSLGLTAQEQGDVVEYMKSLPRRR